jgi:hypothetical protein
MSAPGRIGICSLAKAVTRLHPARQNMQPRHLQLALDFPK